MLLHEYIEKHMINVRCFAENLEVTYEHLRMIMLRKASPSRKLACRISDLTNNEVTKHETMFPEDFEDD
jgi:hypothetical protein